MNYKIGRCKINGIPIEGNIIDYNIDNIKKYIEIETYAITNTINLFETIKNVLMVKDGDSITVANILYTDTILYQVFNVRNIILDGGLIVKRKLLKDDNYTFITFDIKDDKYEYLDITTDDIYHIVASQFVNNGLYITTTDEIIETKFINYLYEKDVCKYQVTMNNLTQDIKYINIINVIINNKDQNKEIDKLINELFVENNDIKHIFTQHHIGVGILSCLAEQVGKNKNNIISKILGDNIYGNVFISLADDNPNSSRNINLTKDLFNKIMNSTKNLSQNMVRKNKNFCNVYLEC